MSPVKPIVRNWKVNGKPVAVKAPPGRRLLDCLREDLGLIGSKEGCGEGECGACTVLVDGEPVVSCIVPVGQLSDGTEILTIEGIEKKRAGRLLQRAYLEMGAVQCGYCIPGMVVSSYALLLKNPKPTTKAIREALSGNLCRCTGYAKIIAAVKLAASRLPKPAK